MDVELTLEKAKKLVRQKEAVKEQHHELRAGARGEGSKNDPIVIAELKDRKHGSKGGAGQWPNRRGSHSAGARRHSTGANQSQCTRCGKERHPIARCAAKDATCHKCGKIGHYSSKCFSGTKATAAVTEDDLSLETTFLGAVSTEQKRSWTVEVLLNDKKTSFKLDTGAEVTAISKAVFETFERTTLRKPAKVLHGPTTQALKVLGQFTGKLKHQQRTTTQPIYVVQGLKSNLLGLPAITALQLLCRMDNVHTEQLDVRKRFPKQFHGLGTLGEAYTIQLKEGAVPYSLFTPRNVPIPLRRNVQEELSRMEAAGVISKVDDPTPWCAGMVVVPKKSGAVRICVDLKPLNEHGGLIRNVHLHRSKLTSPNPQYWHYDPDSKTKISADASSFRLGAVLLQQSSDDWQPVAYASRSLTDTEKRYAQIEKEALAITWACERFATYIHGRSFQIETDHKPLVPLLSTKHLDNLPPRVLRFRLRMAKFDYVVAHIPGKLLYTADALSRAPTSKAGEEPQQLQEEIEAFVESVTSALPASKQRLEIYRKGQAQDAVCKKVQEYCQNDWPRKHLLESTLRPYWEARGSLTLCDGLLLYDDRIVIPSELQRETMEKIHSGHQGIA